MKKPILDWKICCKLQTCSGVIYLKASTEEVAISLAKKTFGSSLIKITRVIQTKTP